MIKVKEDNFFTFQPFYVVWNRVATCVCSGQSGGP